jgi:hypothetical protein
MFEFGDAGLGVATATVGFAMGFLRVALRNGSNVISPKQTLYNRKSNLYNQNVPCQIFSCPIAQCNQDVAIVSAHEPEGDADLKSDGQKPSKRNSIWAEFTVTNSNGTSTA